MSAFIDTNIIVRHLTGDPADMAARATTFLESASGLLLTDLVLAEAVYVLESFYHVPHAKVAEAMRSLIAFKAVITVDPALLLRALEVYEVERLDFAEAYLVASAESSAVNTIVSYDKSIDRITTVERLEPPALPE
jgi:predicted nucleic acid-binding protein